MVRVLILLVFLCCDDAWTWSWLRQKQHMIQLEQRLRESELQVQGALLGRGASYGDMFMLRLQVSENIDYLVKATQRTLYYTVILLTSYLPSRIFIEILVSHGGFPGGSEGERVLEGAVYWAHRLCRPWKGRGRAQAGGSRGRDAPTDWQPEGGLWETLRGDEETGREGWCFPDVFSNSVESKHLKGITKKYGTIKWRYTVIVNLHVVFANCSLCFCFSSICWMRTAFKFLYLVMKRSCQIQSNFLPQFTGNNCTGSSLLCPQEQKFCW